MTFIIVSACVLLGIGAWLTRLARRQLRAPQITGFNLDEEEGPDTLFGVLAGALITGLFACSVVLAAWLEGVLFPA